MLDSFQKFISENQLAESGDRVLLAVSGGIDSVAMAHLFHASGFRTGIVHCNFQLRGKESDDDQEFVRSLAAQYGMAFHTRCFETETTARIEHISIQMAARKMRYEWFEEIRASQAYDWVATAHNQDDVLETFFINLSRGTGIRGLSGIPVKSGRIIRPLLFTSREGIKAYTLEEDLPFREDSSNAALKYLRNRIRHQLLPQFEAQNPSFRRSMADSIRRLADAAAIYDQEMGRLKQSMIIKETNSLKVDIRDLQEVKYKEALLYELLHDYQFPSHSIADILTALEGPSGKQFFSPTHRLVKDRESLILTKLKEDETGRIYLELDAGSIRHPLSLDWVIIERTSGFRIPEDPCTACLDLDLLAFPLILRRWQQGDYFQPLGMEGMKKLSDFFIDRKLSLPEKEQTWILCSGPEIVWIVGQRIDHRYRVRTDSGHIFMIKYSA